MFVILHNRAWVHFFRTGAINIPSAGTASNRPSLIRAQKEEGASAGNRRRDFLKAQVVPPESAVDWACVPQQRQAF
jgi:hypothetical protein